MIFKAHKCLWRRSLIVCNCVSAEEVIYCFVFFVFLCLGFYLNYTSLIYIYFPIWWVFKTSETVVIPSLLASV